MSGILTFIHTTVTTDIYILSLHDALPICDGGSPLHRLAAGEVGPQSPEGGLEVDATVLVEALVLLGDHRLLEHLGDVGDRKSTRLNSSHRCSSYAVFCLKKKHSIGLASNI